MPRPIKKWPDYALGCWTGTMFKLRGMEELARQVQELLVKGEPSQALISVIDIRSEIVEAKHLMHQARNGEYET